jgi:hypothetical protein
LGLPRAAGGGKPRLGYVAFSAKANGCAFGNRAFWQPGWRSPISVSKTPLPTLGVLKASRQGDKLSAFFNNKRVLECTAPAAPVGPGLAVGGGLSLVYSIRKLEISGQLDPAWLEHARRLLAPIRATRADLQKLFAGKVVRFDANTLALELAYDFHDPAQESDWSAGVPPARKGAPKKLEVADGILHLRNLNIPVMLKGVFRQVALSAVCASNKGLVRVEARVQADGKGSDYILRCQGNVCSLHRRDRSQESELTRKRIADLRGTRRVDLSLGYSNGRLKARVGLTSLDVRDEEHAFGQVGLGAEGEVALDNVRVRGTLDRAWLLDELRRPEGQKATAKPK